MTRPPRLKAKPMVGRRADADKQQNGDDRTAGSRQKITRH
jgi:hypothetical protein